MSKLFGMPVVIDDSVPAGHVRVTCPQCRGTGVSKYVVHGHGPDSIEPIRCESCDGFGFIEAALDGAKE
jgi:DnaJ-class molecular chaperone